MQIITLTQRFFALWVFFNSSRISSVSRALDCRMEVTGSIPGAGPILWVLKIS